MSRIEPNSGRIIRQIMAFAIHMRIEDILILATFALDHSSSAIDIHSTNDIILLFCVVFFLCLLLSGSHELIDKTSQGTAKAVIQNTIIMSKKTHI